MLLFAGHMLFSTFVPQEPQFSLAWWGIELVRYSLNGFYSHHHFLTVIQEDSHFCLFYWFFDLTFCVMNAIYHLSLLLFGCHRNDHTKIIYVGNCTKFGYVKIFFYCNLMFHIPNRFTNSMRKLFIRFIAGNRCLRMVTPTFVGNLMSIVTACS